MTSVGKAGSFADPLLFLLRAERPEMRPRVEDAPGLFVAGPRNRPSMRSVPAAPLAKLPAAGTMPIHRKSTPSPQRLMLHANRSALDVNDRRR